MTCPECSSDLSIAERQGVEIDYCAKCRGVWLQRGELDKIVERSRGRDEYEYERAEPAYSSDRQYREHEHYDSRRRKKKSFLGELFDF